MARLASLGVWLRAVNALRNMIAKMLVQGESSSEFLSKRGPRSVVRLSLVELDGEDLYRQMLEYELTDEEKVRYSGKLHGKKIVIGIRELVAFGGRFGARGRIVSVESANGQPVKS